MEEKGLAEPILSGSDISQVENGEIGMEESSDEYFLRHLPLYRPLLHVTFLPHCTVRCSIRENSLE